MPPTIPAGSHRLLKQIAGTMNQSQALATQQQNDWATSDGQVVMRTGVLFQYPASGSVYTSGVGMEILSDGSGSAPTLRLGIINWTNGASSGTILGAVLCNPDGTFQTLWDGSGGSSFLQLLSKLTAKVQWGTTTVFLGNAVVATTIALPTPWPDSHELFLCMGQPQSSAGAGNYHVGSGVVDNGHGDVTVASSFGSGQNWVFGWLSIGN